MGFFKNLWNGAKGVLGRVWEGVKKVAPHVGGVLSKVADITGIPYVKWASRAWDIGKGIYNTLTGKGSLQDKLKGVADQSGDVIDIVRNRPKGSDVVNDTRTAVDNVVHGGLQNGLRGAADLIGKLQVKGA